MSLGIRSFFELRLQRRYVQHRLRQELLQRAVLFFQPLQFASIGGLYPALARPPLVVRRIADAVLPAQIAREGPAASSFKTLVICSSVDLPLRILCLLDGEQNPNLRPGRFRGAGQRIGLETQPEESRNDSRDATRNELTTHARRYR